MVAHGKGRLNACGFDQKADYICNLAINLMIGKSLDFLSDICSKNAQAPVPFLVPTGGNKRILPAKTGNHSMESDPLRIIKKHRKNQRFNPFVRCYLAPGASPEYG